MELWKYGTQIILDGVIEKETLRFILYIYCLKYIHTRFHNNY